MLRSKYPQVEPVLTSVAELDDASPADIYIGLPDGPGGRFRVLQRLRVTLKEAVKQAGSTANILAGASRERVLDPQHRPSAIRISDGPDGSCVWLDYDVGVVGGGRPRNSRPLRLMMLASKLAPLQGTSQDST